MEFDQLKLKQSIEAHDESISSITKTKTLNT